MVEVSGARRVVTLRDFAHDEVAHEYFQKRLGEYREELLALAAELACLTEALDNARKGDCASPASLGVALARTPRERALAYMVRSDAAFIAASVLALLQDRVVARSPHASLELARWEEELERLVWFDAQDIACISLRDDAGDLECLRQLGQLAARLLNDPDAPALPLCPRYVTADDIVPGTLGPDDLEAVPCFAFNDMYQFSSFIEQTVGLTNSPRDRSRATILRLLAGKSLAVDLSDGERVVLLPRALSDRFHASVEQPWCVEGMGWSGLTGLALTPQKADNLRVLDAFNAASECSRRYVTGTRSVSAAAERPVHVDLTLMNIADAYPWYAYSVDDEPALVLMPAQELWESLQAAAMAPEKECASVARLTSAVPLKEEHGVLTITRDVLARVGVDADEQSFEIVGVGHELELWPAAAWQRAAEDHAAEFDSLFA